MSQLSFNDAILRLLNFWKERGCLLWQPYNVQVGAGTMNPGTILRVLGPEPWNIVYVEPSIRPDDGRFGDNPNRMQQHYQLQVILQPDPGNPQELFLQSLEAIGINRREHDIRFVEDNWESPALGAWGLGWEVWLDGQEITQFTYFQQAGSLDLDPVAVEITYGLDRIISALQGVDSVWEIDYGAEVAYENVLLQSEIEHCEYYFNVADVDALRATYDTYERESARCLEAGLVAPAHDYNLKCSHLFNVMDTRGAIGVTERANYFRRMRNMAREISKAFVAQREEKGFPLLDHPSWKAPELQTAAAPNFTLNVTEPQTFLLEIGNEELPAQDVDTAINQLKIGVANLLDELRIEFESIEAFGTPRRTAVLAQKVAARQSDLEMEAKGPPADRAYDADGNPTKAAIGFARGKGVEVSDLRIQEDGKRRYVVATVHEVGRPTAEVLMESLAQVVSNIKFPKSMRWNASNINYSRPLRWFVALFGQDVIPFAFAGVASGRVSKGLRPNSSPQILIDHADNYLQLMATHGIVVDSNKRRHIITSVGKQTASEKGGSMPDDLGLLDEVTNLIERPTVFCGQFEDRFLQLPDEVLVAVMRKHQRYYPVYGQDGNLIPYFIGVRNGDSEHLDKVIHGNEQVIRARFSDAAFFYNNDTKKNLPDFVEDLSKLTFQADLGSMLDKTKRLESTVPKIASMLALKADETKTAAKAASIAKADLATSMVVEMTSLQGIMGGHYAKLSGEDELVAAAVAEQYEAVSLTKPGLALALADRLDSLVGLFAVGLAPKGSNDPFALRRAAIQIVENLVGNDVAFDLKEALFVAGESMPVSVTGDHLDKTLTFIGDRLHAILQEKGFKPTTIRAIINEQAHDPFNASIATAALTKAIALEDWEQLLDAYARCVRITRTLESTLTLKPEQFAEEPEKNLLEAYEKAEQASDGTVGQLVQSLRDLQPMISAFFDNVMVMAEEPAVRENRLALLQRIARLAKGIADLSELEGF